MKKLDKKAALEIVKAAAPAPRKQVPERLMMQFALATSRGEETKAKLALAYQAFEAAKATLMTIENTLQKDYGVMPGDFINDDGSVTPKAELQNGAPLK